MNCPYCNSTDTDFLEKKNKWLCNNCDKAFAIEKSSELTTNPLRIFVSYGHDEYTPFAEELNKGLQKRGHKTFFDSEWLNVGCDWEVRIQSGLNFIAEDPENSRMLLIITPHSVRNDAEPMGYCLNEIAKAMDKRVTIIPVMLVRTDIPASICRLQYLDIHKSPDKESVIGNFDSDFIKICEVLEIPDMLDMRGLTSGLRRELNPIDFTADITLYQPYFTGREWVIDEIRSWLDDDNASRMFWIVGAPGIGKTTISTHLIHMFKNVKAYHFCRRGYSDKASPKRMVCSIAYQLSTLLPDYRNILSSIPIREEIDKSNAKTLFDRLIVQPLSHLASPYDYPLVILIDAIDESTENGKNEVARFIALEFDRLPSWLRVIITSRPDQEVLTPLAKFEPWMLDAKSNSNNADIKAYLNMRLKDYNNNENYCQVINTLQTNADGIFQYAKCICDEVINGKYDFNTPDRLPNTLSEIYFDYFSERFADEEYYIKNVRPALEVIISAYDPISKDELRAILDWDNYNIHRFIKDIGSYIIENSDGKLVASHASVFDWLENINASDIYYVDRTKGLKTIASRLWSLFAESDYNFFYEGVLQRQVLMWMPNLLGSFIKVDKDAMFFAPRYLYQIQNKKYEYDYLLKKYKTKELVEKYHQGLSNIGIVGLVLDYKSYFNFIISFFGSIFKGDKTFYSDSDAEGMLNVHERGLLMLYYKVNNIPPLPLWDNSSWPGREYYYFTEVVISMFYTGVIAEVFEYGILASIYDGRVSTISAIMSDYAKFIYTYYEKDVDGIIRQTENFASRIIEQEGKDGWGAKFANSIRNMGKTITKEILER